MRPVDFILLAVIAAIALGAAWYIRRYKKKGRKCVGCPDSGCCSGSCGNCASAGSCCSAKHQS